MKLERGDALSPYQRVEENARGRAREVQKVYLESVPQAPWLRLDINGAILLTPQEFSALPLGTKEFFAKGNMAHYKKDRVALRGENVILLDGHYSGGIAGERRSERFLSAVGQCLRSVPELLMELRDENKEQWQAKLALWDNLTSLSIAQFHALKALSLLEHDREVGVDRAERDMSTMFEGYFSTLLGKPTDHHVEQVVSGMRSIMDHIASHQDAFVRQGSYDLFRIEREAPGAYSLMGAFSWVADEKLSGVDLALGMLLGGVDGIEAIKFLDRHKDEISSSAKLFPGTYDYVLPRVKAIGQLSRVMGKRSDTTPLLVAQESFFHSIPALSRIAIIDDMITTASTAKELEAVLRTDGFRHISFLVNQIGTRWAVNDLASPEFLTSVHAVGVSPTTRVYQEKHLGLEKLMQKLRTRQSLDAIRRVAGGAELISYLQKAKAEKSAKGVGFDIFGTLIEEPGYDMIQRRKVLQGLRLDKIQKWQPALTAEKFMATYQRVRRRIEDQARRARGPLAEFKDKELWLEILNELGVDFPEQKIVEILKVELEYDKEVCRQMPEMLEAVGEAIRLYGRDAVGVVSNSRMSRTDVIDLLKAYGFVGQTSMIKEENVLASSDLGIKKPAAAPIEILGRILSIPNREIIFVGNDRDDIRAAGRANAIGIQMI